MNGAAGIIIALGGVALIVMAYNGSLQKIWNDLRGASNTTTTQVSPMTTTNGATMEKLNPV